MPSGAGRMLAATIAALALGGCASGDPEPTATEFCAELEQVVAPTSALSQLDIADPGSLEAVISELTLLQASAPPAIEDDASLLVESFTTVLDALGAEPGRPAAEVLSELDYDAGDAAVAGASLERYAAQTCGFELVPSPTPAAGTEPVDG